MGMVEAIQTAFRNILKFSGRASRPEFWWFAGVIYSACLILIAVMIRAISNDCGCGGFGDGPSEMGLINVVALLQFVMIPALMRRLRDAGFTTMHLVPAIGLLIAGVLENIFESIYLMPMPYLDYLPGFLAHLLEAVAILALGAFLISFFLALFPTKAPQGSDFGPNPSEATP